MRLDEAPRRGGLRSGPSDLWSGVSAAGSSNAAWRTGGAGIFSAIRLALLQASHSRWLLLVVAIGILVADVLISTAPLYNTIVPNIQLQNAMARWLWRLCWRWSSRRATQRLLGWARRCAWAKTDMRKPCGV